MNKKTIKDVCIVVAALAVAQLPSLHAQSLINDFNRQKNQILKENPGIELKVENVDWNDPNDLQSPYKMKMVNFYYNAIKPYKAKGKGEIPEKFYEVDGKRFYLEIDGVSLEEYVWARNRFILTGY